MCRSPFNTLSCLMRTALFHAAVVLAVADAVGREELLDREADAAEERAGIILGDRAGALLIGQAVVIGGNEQLCVALKPDDAELADRRKPAAGGVGKDKALVEGRGDRCGDAALLKLSRQQALRIADLAVQADRIDGIDHGDGQLVDRGERHRTV